MMTPEQAERLIAVLERMAATQEAQLKQLDSISSKLGNIPPALLQLTAFMRE